MKDTLKKLQAQMDKVNYKIIIERNKLAELHKQIDDVCVKIDDYLSDKK